MSNFKIILCSTIVKRVNNELRTSKFYQKLKKNVLNWFQYSNLDEKLLNLLVLVWALSECGSNLLGFNDLLGPLNFTIVNVKKRPTTTQLTHLSRAHAPLTVVLLVLNYIIIIICLFGPFIDT